jgi:two-component system cell cycle response regulator
MKSDEGVMADRRTILVIDDDPETSRLVSSWFAGKPYEIVPAHEGRTGIELALRNKPDLILLDIKMPGVDGLTVARHIKHNTETRAIPIILLTACRDVNSKVEAFAVGADDYITKPFHLEEVDARIQALIKRRDFLSGLETTIRHLQDDNEEMERLLVTDEKTGLFNFREFRHQLRSEFLRSERYGDPLSLVLLDIDDFKQINDTLGHQAGDQALAELATLVAGGARKTDMAARYGGEEFAVILPHTDSAMAHIVAQRTRAAIAEFIFLRHTTPIRLSVSAGVATYPTSEGTDTVDALVRAADVAMYEAKKKGKNLVVTAPMSKKSPVRVKTTKTYYSTESPGGAGGPSPSRTVPPVVRR